MKVLGVTIGLNGWKEVAQKTAERMEKNTGVECIVLDRDPIGVNHPSWIKAHLIDIYPKVDRLFIFDADILPLKPFPLMQIIEEAGDMPVGVLDEYNQGVAVECLNYELNQATYINGGFLITGKHHRHVWERVKRGYPSYGSWAEQTALNKALQMTKTNIYSLPEEYNQLYFFFREPLNVNKLVDSKTINLHVCSLHGDANAMSEVQKVVFDKLDKKELNKSSNDSSIRL
jgi:hypothetical protein